MARRATKEEKAFNPVGAALVQSVALKLPASAPPEDAEPRFRPTISPPEVAAEAQTALDPAVGESAEEKPAPILEIAPPPNPAPKARPIAKEPEPPAQTPSLARARRATHAKRVVLSPDEQRFLEELAFDLSQDLQTPVKLSNILRACLILLRKSDKALRKHAKRASSVQRPANSDPAGLAYFEHRLAQFLDLGLRETNPLS